jgi:hypothetical protein
LALNLLANTAIAYCVLSHVPPSPIRIMSLAKWGPLETNHLCSPSSSGYRLLQENILLLAGK